MDYQETIWIEETGGVPDETGFMFLEDPLKPEVVGLPIKPEPELKQHADGSLDSFLEDPLKPEVVGLPIKPEPELKQHADGSLDSFLEDPLKPEVVGLPIKPEPELKQRADGSLDSFLEDPLKPEVVGLPIKPEPELKQCADGSLDSFLEDPLKPEVDVGSIKPDPELKQHADSSLDSVWRFTEDSYSACDPLSTEAELPHGASSEVITIKDEEEDYGDVAEGRCHEALSEIITIKDDDEEERVNGDVAEGRSNEVPSEVITFKDEEEEDDGDEAEGRGHQYEDFWTEENSLSPHYWEAQGEDPHNDAAPSPPPGPPLPHADPPLESSAGAPCPPQKARPFGCLLCDRWYHSEGYLHRHDDSRTHKRRVASERQLSGETSRQSGPASYDALAAPEGAGSSSSGGKPPGVGPATPPQPPPPPAAQPADASESRWEQQQYEDFQPTVETPQLPYRSQEDRPPGDTAPTRPAKPWPHRCYVCGNWFFSAALLRRHYRSETHKRRTAEEEQRTAPTDKTSRQSGPASYDALAAPEGAGSSSSGGKPPGVGPATPPQPPPPPAAQPADASESRWEQHLQPPCRRQGGGPLDGAARPCDTEPRRPYPCFVCDNWFTAEAMLGHHCESWSHRRSRTKKDLKDREAQHLPGQDRFADCGNSFISTINNCSVNSSGVQPVSSEPQGNSKCGPSSIYHKIDKLRRMLLASGGSLLASEGVGNSGGGTGADSRRPAEAGARAPPEAPPAEAAPPPPLQAGVGNSAREQHQFQEIETKPERMSPPHRRPEDPPPDPPPDSLRSPPPAHSPAESDKAPPPADPPPTAYADPPAVDPFPDGYPAPPPEDPAQEGCAAPPPNVRRPWRCPSCRLSFSSSAFLDHQCQAVSRKRTAPGKRHPGDAISKKSRQQLAEPHGGLPAAEGGGSGEPPALGPAAPASPLPEVSPPSSPPPPPVEPPPSPDVGESSRERQYEDFDTEVADYGAPPPDATPNSGRIHGTNSGDVPPGSEPRPYDCRVCEVSFSARKNLRQHCKRPCHHHTALPAEPGSKRSGRCSRITGTLPAPELRPTAPAPPPRQPPPEPPLLWGPPPEQLPDIGNSYHTQVRSSQRLTPADSGAPAYPVQSFRRADTYERQQHAVSGAFEGLLRRLLETDTSEQPFALQTRQGAPQSQQEEKRLRPQQEGHSLDLRHLLQQQLVPGRQLCRGSPSLPTPAPTAHGSAVANTGSAAGQSVPPFCNGGTKGNSRQDEKQNGPQTVIKKVSPAPSLQLSPSVPAGSRRPQPACPDVTIRASEQVPLPLWAPAGAFSDGPRICPVCGGAFSRGYSLREHVRCFHPGSEYFECEVCGVAFAILEEYRAHLAEYAGIGAGKRHPVDECPKSITNVTHPVRHKEVDSRGRPYLCDGRPDQYRNEECPARREWLHVGEGRFQCDECPEHFSTKTILKRHKLKHSGVRSYSKRRFQCDECPDHYPSKALLKRHKLYHFCVRSYSEGRFRCDECPMHYATKTLLKRHKLKHLGVRPYSCHICRQRFYRKDHMRVHLNTIHSRV